MVIPARLELACELALPASEAGAYPIRLQDRK